MSRRVYVHVGAPKTGTTYLQDRLFLNRVSLAGHGIAYPTGLKGDMFEPALDLIDRPWGGMRDEVHGEWDALVRRVKRSSGTVLVSHEILAGARPQQVQRAMRDLRDFEVHVIYTARDIARQLPAEWQEQVKHNGRNGFRRYLRQVRKAQQNHPNRWFWRVQGLPDVLTRWGCNLPPERVHLITVPQPGAPKETLWLRFCEVVGIDPAWAPEEAERHNPSLGGAETTLLRRLNAVLLDEDFGGDDYRTIVREVIAHRTLAQRTDMTRVTLPPGEYDWVEQVAESWIEWAQGAKVHVVGDLDELRPRRPAADEPWVNPDKPRPRDVADAALDALVAVVLEAGRRPNPDDQLRAKVAKAVRRARGGR
ncbi:hypothetical protein AB3X52_09605 [Nocardioides sp. DS6]|uniref:Sulfotransferase family protein n=1 Tax=Nocardioides eburneus TaxID=3231482 RepID=A0ABV3SZ99_9ACTN